MISLKFDGNGVIGGSAWQLWTHSLVSTGHTSRAVFALQVHSRLSMPTSHALKSMAKSATPARMA